MMGWDKSTWITPNPEKKLVVIVDAKGNKINSSDLKLVSGKMELPKYRQIKLARTVGKNIQAVVSTTIYTDGIGYQSCLFLLFSDGTCHGIICEDEESSEEPVAV